MQDKSVDIGIILKWNLKFNTGQWRDFQNTLIPIAQLITKNVFHFFFTGFHYKLESSRL